MEFRNAAAKPPGRLGLHKKDHIRALLRDATVAARWRTAVGRDWTEAEFRRLTDAERDERRAAARRRFLAADAHAAIPTLDELPQLIDRFNATLRTGGKP